VAGLVTYVRHHTTRNGDPMAFAQIEDLQGTIELVIFPRVWEESRDLWETDRILVVRGKVSFRGKDPSILVSSATNEITTVHVAAESPVASAAAKGPVHIHVTVPRNDDMEQVIQRLGQIYDLLQSYPGDDQFSIYVENGSQGQMQIDFPNDTTRHCVELEQALRAALGAGTVRVEPLVSASQRA
jgi:DNA polymerase III alpha subunit